MHLDDLETGLPGPPRRRRELAEDVYVVSNVTAGEPVPMTPTQARAYAAALVRSADKAEGHVPDRRDVERRWILPPDSEATRRTAANLDRRRPENQEDEDAER
ncbi:hypothetical protein [Streptomyces sp. 029-5]|uniref:hypothetical protein n=1 Tax=Streptomyces sp. 029-5 TaxID=2789261 RepID=UPI00397FF4CF